MSLEAVTKIREVENGVEQSKLDARAQGQKLIADAEREGREALKRGREQSEKAAAQAMREAEAKAAQRRIEIISQAEKDCEALKKAARSRMGKAAEAIVRRVVEN